MWMTFTNVTILLVKDWKKKIIKGEWVDSEILDSRRYYQDKKDRLLKRKRKEKEEAAEASEDDEEDLPNTGEVIDLLKKLARDDDDNDRGKPLYFPCRYCFFPSMTNKEHVVHTKNEHDIDIEF